MPIPNLCMRPSDYEDVRLFVPREGYEEILAELSLYLDSPGAKGRRFMVYGDRGVGKSIAVRAAIQELQARRDDFFPVCVRGDRCLTTKQLLSSMADELASQVRKLFPGEEDLHVETSYLKSIIGAERLTRGEFRKTGAELEVSIKASFGLLSFITHTLGITGAISRAIGEEREEEETTEIPVDDFFRLELLSAMLPGIARKTGKEPLIFVDNLDQLAEATREPQIVHDHLRALFRLDQVPVVITVRSEFARDIQKESRTPLRLEGLPPEQLQAILEKRLEVDCPQASALREAGVLEVGRELTRRTDNPWVFLRWLEYLCTKELEPSRCWENLKGYIQVLYGFWTDEVERIAEWFFQRGLEPARAELIVQEVGLDRDDVRLFEENGVLVPDDYARPPESRRYTLSPLLVFLR